MDRFFTGSNLIIKLGWIPQMQFHVEPRSGSDQTPVVTCPCLLFPIAVLQMQQHLTIPGVVDSVKLQ